MSLDTFVAGRYSATYASADVGITDEGYELQQDAKAELIDRSDAYGDSIIDFIYRGGDVYLQFLSKAYKAGSVAAFWPWGGATGMGAMFTALAPLSRLAFDVAGAMVLTVVANTPAGTLASPTTLTGSKSILAPNSPAKLLYNSKLRQVPVRLLLLPTINTGTVTWFIQT